MPKMMLVAMAMLTAAPAATQSITAANPAAVAAAMQAAGYKARLTKANNGDPRIESAAAGKEFTVEFENCENARACTSLMFTAGFDLDKPMALDRVNAWNKKRRFAFAWTDDEGDPFLQMDVNTDPGGLPTALFTDSLEIWTASIGEFRREIGW